MEGFNISSWNDLNNLASSHGIALALSLIANVILYRQLIKAWAANIDLTKAYNTAMLNITVILEAFKNGTIQKK